MPVHQHFYNEIRDSHINRSQWDRWWWLIYFIINIKTVIEVSALFQKLFCPVWKQLYKKKVFHFINISYGGETMLCQNVGNLFFIVMEANTVMRLVAWCHNILFFF